MTTVEEIIKRIEKFAPTHLAESWDPIGLAFGSKKQTVKKIIVALDLDANTLQEAKDENVDLIFTHHPPIFSSLKTLNADDPRRNEYLELIKSDIALYTAHTNIDAAEDGMNDWLAETLGLEKPYDIIDFSYQDTYKLLVLYTPEKDADKMRNALHKAGAGQVGDYDNVSYTSTGTGRFTPERDANPTIGSRHSSEHVTEERTEVLVPNHLIGQVVQTIYEVHPYEEPVFYLMEIGKKEKDYGIGRVGTLSQETSFNDMIEVVKDTFKVSDIRYANVDLDMKIKKVAILGGSGENYYKQALAQGADLYITGDISYHGAQDMIREGLPFIDPGHFIEEIFVPRMTEKLMDWSQENGWDVEVISSKKQQNVFKFK